MTYNRGTRSKTMRCDDYGTMRCDDNYSFDFNYYDENGRIKEDLFSDIAENIVKKCLKPKSKKEKLTLNQIRKFYDEVLNYESLIKSAENKEKEFKEWIPYIRMLKAKAHVAYERGNINKNFKIFIEKNINYIGKDYKKFKVFVKFFEAIIAYSKGTLEQK